MSCEIFRKIKQMENGDFLVTSKSSNCGGSPKEWVMDYYRLKYPNFTNTQRKAVFILSGLYFGNKYYPESYRKLEKLGREYNQKLYEETGKLAYRYVTDYMSQEGYAKDVARVIREGGTIKYCSYEEYLKAAHEEAIFVVNGFIEFIKEK